MQESKAGWYCNGCGSFIEDDEEHECSGAAARQAKFRMLFGATPGSLATAVLHPDEHRNKSLLFAMHYGMGWTKLSKMFSAKVEWCSGCGAYVEEGHDCPAETGAQQMTGLLLDRVQHANAFV